LNAINILKRLFDFGASLLKALVNSFGYEIDEAV